MYSAYFLCNFSNCPDHPATKFQSSSCFERNHRTSRAAARDHKPENGFLNHGEARLGWHGWPFCYIFGRASADYDTQTACRVQHRCCRRARRWDGDVLQTFFSFAIILIEAAVVNFGLRLNANLGAILGSLVNEYAQVTNCSDRVLLSSCSQSK